MLKKIVCFCLLVCLSLSLSATSRVERVEKDVGELLWKMVSGGLAILESRMGADYAQLG